jgi:hypothetical protein
MTATGADAASRSLLDEPAGLRLLANFARICALAAVPVGS